MAENLLKNILLPHSCLLTTNAQQHRDKPQTRIRAKDVWRMAVACCAVGQCITKSEWAHLRADWSTVIDPESRHFLQKM